MQCLAICHRYILNSIVAENFIKVPLLQAYLSASKFSIFCLSETYLNSIYSNDDSRSILIGYSLLREDHPSDIK